MLRAPTNVDLNLAILVIFFGTTGTYLLLPHRLGSRTPRKVHLAGSLLATVALLLFASFWRVPAPLLTRLFFYAFSLAAIVAAVLTVTSRNPIHSALWFAAVILSTSGLFLLAGAQFLAAGTVIVYAGAIIVTFLFVIMLAQMEGRSLYDRSARSPATATLTCFLLFWGVVYSLISVRHVPAEAGHVAGLNAELRLVRNDRLLAVNNVARDRPVRDVLKRAVRRTNLLDGPNNVPKSHVAGLGEALYTDDLIAVELAGALLFVALIGALAIAAPKPPVRPGAPTAPATPHIETV